MRSTYDELHDLFHSDERLRRTIPTRSYELDPVQFERYKQEVGPNWQDDFKFLKIGFADWMRGFADVFDQILDLPECDLIITTGKVQNDHSQSASDLWIDYIVRAFLILKGYELEEYNDFWYVARKGHLQGKPKHVLFLDDWIRGGAHMSIRIFSTPDLTSYLVDPDTLVFVGAPIAPSEDDFLQTFVEVGYDQLDPEGARTPANTTIIEGFIKRIRMMRGILLDSRQYPNVLLDHNSGETFDSEMFYGYVRTEEFMPIFIGSLVKGADPLSKFRYPPPLYHIEFGSGRLPENTTKLKELKDRPGYYTYASGNFSDSE